MAKPFETTIKRARFDVSGYEPILMAEISDKLVASIKERLADGLDANDGPAPALSFRQNSESNWPSYANQKIKAGKQPMRDWNFTGRTLRSLHTLSATDNRAIIGFDDAGAGTSVQRSSRGVTWKRKLLAPSAIAAINNRRSRQFAVSPRNQVDLMKAIHDAGSPVQIKTR